MKRTKHNPRIGRDTLADVARRMERNPNLRARIDAAIARATIGVRRQPRLNSADSEVVHETSRMRTPLWWFALPRLG